jgi:hypothetical protein
MTAFISQSRLDNWWQPVIFFEYLPPTLLSENVDQQDMSGRKRPLKSYAHLPNVRDTARRLFLAEIPFTVYEKMFT